MSLPVSIDFDRRPYNILALPCVISAMVIKVGYCKYPGNTHMLHDPIYDDGHLHDIALN